MSKKNTRINHPCTSINRRRQEKVKCLAMWAECWAGCKSRVQKHLSDKARWVVYPEYGPLFHTIETLQSLRGPLPTQKPCVAAMYRLQPGHKRVNCAGLKGHYNPSLYMPTYSHTITTSIHGSLCLHPSRVPLATCNAMLLHTN